MILLNKADLASEADLTALEAVVRSLNPAARVVRTVSSDLGLAEVLGTGEFDLDEASQAAGWVQVGQPLVPLLVFRVSSATAAYWWSLALVCFGPDVFSA